MPKIPLSRHLGSCEGWDSGGRSSSCDDAEVAKIVKNAKKWLGTGATSVHAAGTKTGTWLAAHSKVNGGWGHPRDHEHCLEISANVTRSMDAQ